MISIYYGKPGAGKSLGLMRILVWWLRTTEKWIVTNLDLDVAKLHALLNGGGDRYPYADCPSRIRRISLDDLDSMRQFWLLRGRDPDGEWVTLKPVGERVPLESSASKGGVLYLIDEASILFDCRSYASVAAGFSFYLNQHRKAGDEVIFACPNFMDLDKKIRGIAGEFVEFKNNRFRRYLGVFRGSKYITARIFSHAPAVGSQPIEYFRMQVDRMGVASCYNTASGVGLSGGVLAADRGKAIRGIPAWTVIIPILLLAFLIWWGPQALARTYSAKLGRAMSLPSSGGSSPAAATVSLSSAIPAPAVVPVASGRVLPEGDFLTVTGVASVGSKSVAYLSDGTVARNVVHVADNFVVFSDGTTRRFSRPGTGREVGGGGLVGR